MKMPKHLKDVDKYNEFIRAGGGKSGIYDISDIKTKKFVKRYKKFIDNKEIYKRDKKGQLMPKYHKYRKEHKRWHSHFN